ncbi:MAG: hypothetical protein ACRCY9_15250, partial [Phycicoccus sp.]
SVLPVTTARDGLDVADDDGSTVEADPVDGIGSTVETDAVGHTEATVDADPADPVDPGDDADPTVDPSPTADRLTGYAAPAVGSDETGSTGTFGVGVAGSDPDLSALHAKGESAVSEVEPSRSPSVPAADEQVGSATVAPGTSMSGAAATTRTDETPADIDEAATDTGGDTLPSDGVASVAADGEVLPSVGGATSGAVGGQAESGTADAVGVAADGEVLPSVGGATSLMAGEQEASGTDGAVRAPLDGEAAASGMVGEEAASGRRISDLEEVRDGGYSVGSAAPFEDGAQPLGHAVQAYRDSMSFVVPGDPGYDAREPDVWFYDEGAAERAGFHHVTS